MVYIFELMNRAEAISNIIKFNLCHKNIKSCSKIGNSLNSNNSTNGYTSKNNIF